MVPIPTVPNPVTTTLLSPERTCNLCTGEVVAIPTFSLYTSAVNTVPPTPTSRDKKVASPINVEIPETYKFLVFTELKLTSSPEKS